MTERYHTVGLFGGAITAQFPETFGDVSDIRQVPDNQEVYLDRDGYSSIIVEILQRVEKPTDLEALKFHLYDIADEDAGEVKVYESSPVRFAKLPPGTPGYTLFASSPPGEKQKGRPHEPDFVGILLALIRLEEKKTDIVIAVNVPHVRGEYEGGLDFEKGKFGPLVEKAVEIRKKIVESFEIKLWGLFIDE